MLTKLRHSGTPARLECRKQILDLIDARRQREGDPGIGGSIERCILAQELAQTEQDTKRYGAVAAGYSELRPEDFQESRDYSQSHELVMLTVTNRARKWTVPEWATLSHRGPFEP
jgi:hypothetical protein